MREIFVPAFCRCDPHDRNSKRRWVPRDKLRVSACQDRSTPAPSAMAKTNSRPFPTNHCPVGAKHVPIARARKDCPLIQPWEPVPIEIRGVEIATVLGARSAVPYAARSNYVPDVMAIHGLRTDGYGSSGFAEGRSLRDAPRPAASAAARTLICTCCLPERRLPGYAAVFWHGKRQPASTPAPWWCCTTELTYIIGEPTTSAAVKEIG